jgi:IPT/TIG domain
MDKVLRSRARGDSSVGRRGREPAVLGRAAVVLGAALAVGVLAASARAATVTGYAPVSGTAQLLPYCDGTPITITGSGFMSDGGTVVVKFNGVQAGFVQVGSDTSLTTVIPPNATSGPITVTTAAGTATSAGSSSHGNGINNLGPGVFVVAGCEFATPEAKNPVPASISSVSPSKGKAGTTITITIAGSLVSDVKRVQVGGVAALHTVVSDAKITAIVPKKAKAGASSVSVTTADGSVISSKKFTVTK